MSDSPVSDPPLGPAPLVDLSGRVVLITGATRNIGRASALAFARAGATVAVTAREVVHTAESVEAIAAAGGEAHGFALDLAASAAPAELAGSLLERFGHVDIVVHNAAIRPPTLLGEIDPTVWDEVFAVNVRGAMLLSQALVPAMREVGWGRLVFIGGISSYIGQHGRTAVLASKLAVVGLARSLAFELAPSGVTVNVVVPGTIDTTRGDASLYGPALDRQGRERNVPMARLGRPEDVANACLFLASDLAAYTTGQEFFVAGGAAAITREGVL